LKIILFIILALSVGGILNWFNYDPSIDEKIEFNYEKSDSLFDSTSLSLKNVEKRVDSKQELLDFSVDKSSGSTTENKELLEKSININTADIELFMKLPGIGIKTAEKILELRNQRGGFSELSELLEVKGIGEVKFGRIKKYIYIAK
jgi:competence ComEA-like helix-hairpin-helix protein